MHGLAFSISHTSQKQAQMVGNTAGLLLRREETPWDVVDVSSKRGMATSGAAFMSALRFKRIDVRRERAPGRRRGGLVHARAVWEAKEKVGQLPAKVAWSKPAVGAAWLVAAACAWATWSWVVQPARDAWKQAGGWKPMAHAARTFVQEETKLGKALEWPTAKEASRDTLLVLVCAAALVVFLCTVDSFWVKTIVGCLRKRSGMPS